MKQWALYLAWLIALVGVFVSLYLGELLHMEPCRLCWYQRIALFPLALFLGIAAYKNESRIALYSLPLVILGALLAIYQALSQIFSSLRFHALCGSTEHCYAANFVPWASAAAFILIAILIFLARKSGKVE